MKANMMLEQPFWKAKSLHEMTNKEWESICCRCGFCCLHRLNKKDSDDAYFTQVACRYLDLGTCLCTIYENRFQIDKDCEKITPNNLLALKWLPKFCGYRTVMEGRDLAWWHPLISGSSDTVHLAGISIKNKGITSENDIIAGSLLKNLLTRILKKL